MKMPLQLQTLVKIDRSATCINHQTPAMFIGSCFSDNIGIKLHRLKFHVLLNPFGVLYNPLSIAKAVGRIIDCSYLTSDQLIEDNHMWHSLDLHGSFSNTSKEIVLNNANIEIDRAHRFLKNAKFLFITFGTAWVYQFIKTGHIVANCHKIKADQFDRFRLNLDEISNTWFDLLAKIKKFNPSIKVVFTVSPVRHLKDGANGNQLSKASLLLAIDQLINNSISRTSLEYFPAFELVNDELRDYRYYAPDMVHLNEVCVNYIFEKFAACYFNNETELIMSEVDKIVTATEHRVLNYNPFVIKKFTNDMLKKIESLTNKCPFLDFTEETEYFRTLNGINS
jgi:hypothetical protein